MFLKAFADFDSGNASIIDFPSNWDLLRYSSFGILPRKLSGIDK